MLQRLAGNCAVGAHLARSRPAVAVQRDDDESGGGFFDSILTAVGDAASEVADTVGDLSSQVAETVGEAFSDVAEAVGDVTAGATEAVSDVADAVVDTVTPDQGGPSGGGEAAGGGLGPQAAEAQRQRLLSELSRLQGSLPAQGIALTPGELASLNGQLARLSSVTGAALPSLAPAETAAAAVGTLPIALPSILAALEAIAAAIAALTVGELLLIAAVIVAIVLFILSLLRGTIDRPVPVPIEVPTPTPVPDDGEEPRPGPRPRPDDPPPPPLPPPPTPRVEFGPVRAPNTPVPMPDRLPDGGVVDVPVQVTGWNPSMGPIAVAAAGQGRGGTVTLDGAPSILITDATTSIAVAGDRQTLPRAGTPLALTATLGVLPVGRSAGFAVAAIMQDMSTRLQGPVDEANVGMLAQMRWSSDGRSINSLDEIEYEEQVALLEEDGCFAGTGLGDHGGLLLASLMPSDDEHSSPRAVVSRGPGRQTIRQVWAFLDNRTGSIGMTVRASGFVITRIVEEDPARPGKFLFRLIKQGQAGTVGSNTATAAAGISAATVALQ
ncbi:hypothetical protein [Cellulomonas cellasea]|uniref:Uncharacterized protein n=1 Tax=Cellulomonas cellasea TaxID=43670 RepID=A0A7W4UK06_9CELL|nr:hypothetical protein [Cellulomonas cellasea]MBB2925576.1 hypothetical protein [Cellulomonas cellasea]